jgi:hypothetical protein
VVLFYDIKKKNNHQKMIEQIETWKVVGENI